MAALVLDNCKKVRTALPDVKFYISTETLKEVFKIVSLLYLLLFLESQGDKMEIKEHDRKVIRHTPVCSLMCCVKPSYAGLRSGTHFIISIPLISVFFSFSIFINLFLVHLECL